MSNLQAVGNWVIVKPVQEEQKTTGGIIVPQKKMSEKGKVISVGTDVTAPQVGQTVLFKKWEGVEIKWEGEKYIAFEPKHILGIFEDEV